MKKISLLVLGLYLIAQNSNAQFDIESFKTPAQQMVENAIKPAIVVVRSSFQIKNNNTGVLFGLNGSKEFGEQISYGIKTKDGIVLNDCAICPWNYNEKFLKYKREYSPVFSGILYSNIGESAKYDSLDFKQDNLKTLVDSSWYYCFSKTFINRGLVFDNSLGEKNGWLLWIAKNKEVDMKKSTELLTIVQQKKIEISKENDNFDLVPPKTDYYIIGGLFVIPNYDIIGSVNFQLVGIMDNIGNKWKLICPFHDFHKCTEVGADDANSEISEVKEDIISDELTPINDKPKSKKKNKIKSRKKK